MIRKIDHTKMGTSNLGWLRSRFHFSFAEYYNPRNIQFGALRVINDDLIDAGTGFDTHPHRDMEIISYVVDGELTHGDSMGNTSTITRGHMQYMSAGTGVYHSEFNRGTETARLLQIWIFPDEKGHHPNYGEYRFDWDLRVNQWMHAVSSKSGRGPIKINQDVYIAALSLDEERKIDYPVLLGRQAYLILIEGKATINNVALTAGDALESVEEDIHIFADTQSHFLIIEMMSS